MLEGSKVLQSIRLKLKIKNTSNKSYFEALEYFPIFSKNLNEDDDSVTERQLT